MGRWAIPSQSADKVLREGATGIAVWSLQRALNGVGFSLVSTDGAFGPATKSAVMRFQEHVKSTSDPNFAVDGIAGNGTQKHLAQEIIVPVEGIERTPHGLLAGFAEGEGGWWLDAVNWSLSSIVNPSIPLAKSGVDCFAGDEMVLTDDGAVTLAEACGESVRALGQGGFNSAEIRYFGIRPVQAITMRPASRRTHNKDSSTFWATNRTSIRRTVVATPTHRWPTFNRGEVDDLRPGDVVPTVRYTPERSDRYREAFVHGLVFGDGSHSKQQKNGRHLHTLQMYGGRVGDAFADGVLDGYTLRRDPSCERESYHGTVSVMADRNLKTVPVDHDPEYLAGFVDGWLCADGDRPNGGAWRLRSISYEALDWLEVQAPLAGYIVVGKGEEANEETNLGRRSRKMRWLKLSDTCEAFRVDSVIALGDRPVYCAVVPGEEHFALGGGLYTHNCGLLQRRVYEVDWADDAVIERAFDTRYQADLVAKSLVNLRSIFLPRLGTNDNYGGMPAKEKAWRLAALNHNYPAGADRLSRTPISALDDYWTTPQTWVISAMTWTDSHGVKHRVTFPNGRTIDTPLDWCHAYAGVLGAGKYGTSGSVTRFVSIWP